MAESEQTFEILKNLAIFLIVFVILLAAVLFIMTSSGNQLVIK